MYILGLASRPIEMKAFTDFRTFKNAMEALLKANPGCTISSFYLKDVSRIYLVGVKGKMDSLCVFTTSEEMQEQQIKYGRFYTPSEVYSFALGDEGGDQ